jgi:hypothetical protein
MAIRERYASSAGAGAHDGSSEADAWSFAEMLTSASTGTPAAGDRINFKGTHTLTGNASFNYAGTITSPVIVRGYSSTIGDCSALGRTNGNGPLVTTGMPVFSLGIYQMTTPAFCVLEAVKLESTTRAGQMLSVGNYGAVFRVSVTNGSTNAAAGAIDIAGTNAMAVDCDAVLSGASGGAWAMRMQSVDFAHGCRIDGGPSVGLLFTSTGVAVHCTIIGGTDVVKTTSTATVFLVANCTLVGGSSDGVDIITAHARTNFLVGNLITDHGAYGIYAADAAAGVFAINNRLDRNNGGGTGLDVGGATDWLSAFSGHNDTTSITQANEYESAAGDDYRLKSGSPARQIGLPLYMDVGALQRIEDYPAVGNVQNDDTVDGATGTLTLPAVGDVETGVQYGAGGTEFTGTLTAGSGGGGPLVGASALISA